MAITRLGPNQDITAAKIAGQINFKNLIINGDMSIAQRGTQTGQTGNGFSVDRFKHQITNGGTWTLSQDTDVPTGQGFGYSYKWDCTTADTSLAAGDRLRILYRLEGQMIQSLKYGTSNAETVTISFWVKSNKTGAYSFSMANGDITKQVSASWSISSADTWEKKTLTFVGTNSPSIANNNTDFLQLNWWLGAGTTYTSGSYQSTFTTYSGADSAAGQTNNLADSTSNYINITGVQLEADTSASDFEFLPYDVNLRRCQRYCAVYGKNAPGATNYGPFPGMAMCVGSTTNVELQLIHPVDLRTADVSVSSSSVHVSNIVSQGSDISSINIRSSNKGIRATNFYATASSALTQDRLFYIMTANTPAGYMIVDAEL